MTALPLGPVMADVAGFELTDDEARRLSHPLIGGVILFRRNFQNPAQLRALTKSIKALRQPELLIAVDHEGGRVQRFIEGFTRLPAMATLGERYDRRPEAALALAQDTGWVLAQQLRACGVDLSFTPVLDLNWGKSGVIGDRSFHRQPEAVTALARALIQGLNRAGMRACAKHFPGHGFVDADSHHALPIDSRAYEDIRTEDLQPFANLSGELAAVMPAHVLYPKIDAHNAGFSPFWLKTVLRERLGFQGAVFSDDLTMQGAAELGAIGSRAQAALAAGCDIVLVCNRPDWVDELLCESLSVSPYLAGRWEAMRADVYSAPDAQAFAAAQHRVAALAKPALAPGVAVGESA